MYIRSSFLQIVPCPCNDIFASAEHLKAFLLSRSQLDRNVWLRRLTAWCVLVLGLDVSNLVFATFIAYELLLLLSYPVRVHSWHHFLLQQRMLVLLRGVLASVNFVAALLAKGHHQASAKAAAHKDGHNAEVEDHRSLGIESLHTWNSKVVIFILVFLHFAGINVCSLL